MAEKNISIKLEVGGSIDIPTTKQDYIFAMFIRPGVNNIAM